MKGCVVRRGDLSTTFLEALQPLVLAGHEPIILCSAQVRRFVRRIIEGVMPKVVVLSFNEIDTSVKLESEGQLEA